MAGSAPNSKTSSGMKKQLLNESSSKPKSLQSPRSSSVKSTATSKVREYIARVKKSDLESKAKLAKPTLSLSLEQLYETDVDRLNSSLPSSSTDANLSQTLRALKEKENLILELRQSCSELSIRCANAENTIDELRFARRGPLREATGSHQSTVSRDLYNPVIHRVISRKDASVETESEVLEEVEEASSNVDWLEKVHNWKADIGCYNASHEESCGDSGFRGSEMELSRLALPGPSNRVEPVVSAVVGTQTDFPPEAHTVNVDRDSSWISGNESRLVEDRQESSNLKNLDAILQDATVLARRVKAKSQRLAELLNDS